MARKPGDCLKKTSQKGIYFSGAAGWLVSRDYRTIIKSLRWH